MKGRRKREPNFPQVETEDLGKALYLLQEHNELVRVEFSTERRNIKGRFKMVFRGMDIWFSEQSYISFREDAAVDFSLLGRLCAEIEACLKRQQPRGVKL